MKAWLYVVACTIIALTFLLTFAVIGNSGAPASYSGPIDNHLP